MHMTDQDVDEPVYKKSKHDKKSGVSAFFTKASEKPKSNLRWEIRKNTLLFGRYKTGSLTPVPGKKVKLAAFDLDGTLILTKSGSGYAKDEHDWRYFDKSVPRKLEELSMDGWTVVIFTNQAGLKLGTEGKRLSQFKAKVNAITMSLDIPLVLFAATEHDHFRKPRQGMFSELLQDIRTVIGHEQLQLDMEQSFFVGDAAGRPAKATNIRSVKDFSASDRKFAINARLKFHTPEEFFQSAKAVPFILDVFDPRAFTQPEVADHIFERLAPQEIVLFVGCPAAGKSTYFHTFMASLGYMRINQDTLKTREKCLVEAKKLLLEGRSVCVDNTNASIETRAVWLNLARDHKLPVRVVHFTADAQLCAHNNLVRAFCPRHGEEERKLLSAIAFTSFTARYQPPRLDEGFTHLDTVDFLFTGNDEELRNWRLFWL